MSIKNCVFCLLVLISTTSCLAVKIVDTAVDTTVGVTKVAVKTTGKVVGAAIPDGDNDNEEARAEE